MSERCGKDGGKSQPDTRQKSGPELVLDFDSRLSFVVYTGMPIKAICDFGGCINKTDFT